MMILYYIISNQIWESRWKILALVLIPEMLAAAVEASAGQSPGDEAHQWAVESESISAKMIQTLPLDSHVASK